MSRPFAAPASSMNYSRNTWKISSVVDLKHATPCHISFYANQKVISYNKRSGNHQAKRKKQGEIPQAKARVL
jgi:hypothetical protein